MAPQPQSTNQNRRNNGGKLFSPEVLDSSTRSTPFATALRPKPCSSASSGGARGGGGGFFHSCPPSPMHAAPTSAAANGEEFEFEFSASSRSAGSGRAPGESMSSADELFLNGRIRPMNLKPQLLEETEMVRKRRTKSMSNPRSSGLGFGSEEIEKLNESADGDELNLTATASGSSSASSSRRNSRRWVSLKDYFLHRSKSEGCNNDGKSRSLLPAKEKKGVEEKKKQRRSAASPASAHEVHYKARRAEAEEMKKKTFLPYRQGLFGCLGFSSKGCGAIHGFARAFNPVSST